MHRRAYIYPLLHRSAGSGWQGDVNFNAQTDQFRGLFRRPVCSHRCLYDVKYSH
jgi:hypothetical protein